MNAISLKGRSVLGLQDFTAGEIERILEVAAQMKKIVLSDNKKRDFLKGKSIVTVFSEASTRTRSSRVPACAPMPSGTCVSFDVLGATEREDSSSSRMGSTNVVRTS